MRVEIECPVCGNKSGFKLGNRDLLFTLQDCICGASYTQIVRNIKIEDGKLTGEIVGPEEMYGANSNKGGEGDGKEKE